MDVVGEVGGGVCWCMGEVCGCKGRSMWVQ